jgi:hypothetical protein
MKTIIILTAALLATSAYATDYEKICNMHGRLSEQIMKNRQLGVPLSDMLKIGRSQVTKNIIMAAYKEPRMHTEEYQTRAIEDFRIAQEVMCHEMAEEHKARKAE